MQARKAVAAAITEGRIDDSWLFGKKLVFHSPEASMIEVRIEAAHSFAGLKLAASAFAHVLLIASARSVSQFVPLDIQGYFESIPPGGASPLPLGVCLPDVVIPDVDLPDTGSCSD